MWDNHRSSTTRIIGAILTTALVITFTGTSIAQQTAPGSSKEAALTQLTGRLQDRTFHSESLSRPMRYRVLLPSDYASGNFYPVLYLLHGWHGDCDNWSTLTNLTGYTKDLGLIVVMPDAEDSWYVDSATAPQDRFEQYIIHDLIDDVEHHWHALRSPHRRAVAGLSMGGYAAIKFALKYPDMFATAASLSGAFNAPLPELAEGSPNFRPSLDLAFGPVSSKTRSENDVYTLATHVSPASVPHLLLDCGYQDATFLAPNRKLVSILSQRDFQYEYHEHRGAHNWQYWDEHLPEILDITMRYVADKR
jgi:putative tributyrin esterase